MRKLDYNKILLTISLILMVCFCLSLINCYINYNFENNIKMFSKCMVINIIQYVLPSIVFIYLYNQNTKVKQTCYIVNSKKIPNRFKGYKIAHISDFHNTNSKRAKGIIVKKLKENKPDIIVITGDLIDSRRTNISTASEFIEKISLVAPVYYVLGNHESRLTNIQELENKIQEAGTNILRNETITVTQVNDFIQLIGLDDPGFYSDTEDLYKIQEKLDEKLKTVLNKNKRNNSNNFKILLTHRPEHIKVYSDNKLDLVFTGHAHGGQIRIPFVGGIIAPGQGFFPKYTKGIHEMNNTKMIVSRGIGNSKFPFRVNNRPELIITTLISKNN